MELKCLKFEVKSGIATITLDRPEKLNALSSQLFRELNSCLDEAADDEEVAALIITGGEKVFSAGMDIEELMQLGPGDTFPFWNYGYNLTFERINSFRVPVIAAVSGYALAGGFELAVSCDFRIASETARFALLEVNVGLTPGIEKLWRLVGMSRAKYLGLTCDIIGAEEAYRIGLVDRVVSVNELLSEAWVLAAKFVAKPRRALEMGKQGYNLVPDMGHQAAINYETAMLCNLFDSDERRQIMEQFLKK